MADQESIAELTRLALAQAAPEELAVFEDAAQEYFADPQAALSASGRRRGIEPVRWACPRTGRACWRTPSWAP